MANSPKKAPVAAVSMRAIETAPVFAAAPAPFVETPQIPEAQIPEAQIPEDVEAAQVAMAPVVEMAQKIEAASTEVAARPFAAVTKFLEAPMPSLSEAQVKVREMVETGLSDTHSKYEKMKSAADHAAQALEASYATVKHGAVQFNVKALEALSESANANFDFFKSVFAVKSPSEYVTLQTEFARKQIELMTAQSKAFGELAQKVAVETVAPIKAQVAKTFNVN